MNRILSRLALLAILLISILGVYQGGGGATSNQEQEPGISCDKYIAYHETNDPPEADPEKEREDFVIDSIFRSPEGPNSPEAQTLIQLGLQPNGEVSILPEGNAILRVDDGGVTLWNCGPGEIEVLYSDSDETTIIGAGENAPIHPGEAIYVDAEDIYYLSEGIAVEDASPEADGSPVAGTQPLNKELSPDALPATHHGGGSHVSGGVVEPYKLCSKGGC